MFCHRIHSLQLARSLISTVNVQLYNRYAPNLLLNTSVKYSKYSHDVDQELVNLKTHNLKVNPGFGLICVNGFGADFIVRSTSPQVSTGI